MTDFVQHSGGFGRTKRRTGSGVPDKAFVEVVKTGGQPSQKPLSKAEHRSVLWPNPAQYVGTPVIGTLQAAGVAGIPSGGPTTTIINRSRRFAWGCVAFLAAWFIAFIRFLLARVLLEPAAFFKIGCPGDYALGIDQKWLQKYQIWVDRTPDRLFVIYARCTRLVCTPDWNPAENKFKCLVTAAAMTAGDQLRRSVFETDGPCPCRTGPRWPDCRRRCSALLVAQRAERPIQRPRSLLVRMNVGRKPKIRGDL
jgi:hypothetical protein